MPKRTRTPKPSSADVGTPAVEVNPQFASRPGVEVVHDLRSAQGRSPHLDVAQKQIEELQELVTHIGQVFPRASSLTADACKRIADLRRTLSL